MNDTWVVYEALLLEARHHKWRITCFDVFETRRKLRNLKVAQSKNNDIAALRLPLSILDLRTGYNGSLAQRSSSRYDIVDLLHGFLHDMDPSSALDHLQSQIGIFFIQLSFTGYLGTAIGVLDRDKQVQAALPGERPRALLTVGQVYLPWLDVTMSKERAGVALLS